MPYVPWKCRMGDRSEDPRCPVCRAHPCACRDDGESTICQCGHDLGQHVKGGPHDGECLASDRLGYLVCRCDRFVP